MSFSAAPSDWADEQVATRDYGYVLDPAAFHSIHFDIPHGLQLLPLVEVKAPQRGNGGMLFSFSIHTLTRPCSQDV
jgi:hypothetical protein